MNHRREAGKFQTAGTKHQHPLAIEQQYQPPPSQSKPASQSVFVEKEIPRKKKKFTRE
jgi:hypothetical protein